MSFFPNYANLNITSISFNIPFHSQLVNLIKNPINLVKLMKPFSKKLKITNRKKRNQTTNFKDWMLVKTNNQEFIIMYVYFAC